MFTGLVEATGTVTRLDAAPGGARLEVATGWPPGALADGDSVAVNGCCVTVTSYDGGRFSADLVAETLRRTTLGDLAAGSAVNLERPLAAGDRLGGHIVQGHVDGLATLVERAEVGDGAELTFQLAPELARYVVEKGSIAVDGVSLTVASAEPDRFGVALIPATLAATTLGRLAPGGRVNLEVDVLAKYVERLAVPYTQPTRSGT
jgi:riboflavin synthase